MRSEPYFQDKKRMLEALEKYRTLTTKRAWSIRESKYCLYQHARIAFDSAQDDADRRESHQAITDQFRRYWQVGRNGRLWPAKKIFETLTSKGGACSRASGLTLLSLDALQNQEAVVEFLRQLRGLKKLASRKYPVMAVSKNVHFLNPRLFVIYDNAVIGNQVWPLFRKDRRVFFEDDKFLVDSEGEELDSYFAYLLWAGHMIGNSYARLMADFAQWFVNVVREKGCDVTHNMRRELETYYATAFEFIIIGAALLENKARTSASSPKPDASGALSCK